MIQAGAWEQAQIYIDRSKSPESVWKLNILMKLTKKIPLNPPFSKGKNKTDFLSPFCKGGWGICKINIVFLIII
jgi:hypothetical protein